MYKTKKMMESILIGKESKVDEIKLIKEYQEKLSPNILAYFYCNNFGIIQRTSLFYPIITEEDKASFCLQELDKCLQIYKKEYDTKFITFFIKCYKNRLRMEMQLLNTNKRKTIFNSSQVELYSDILYYENDIIENVEDILNNYNLTNYEKKQCELLDKGYTITEIADMLKLKPITIYKRLEKIKQKILKYDINFA